MNAWVLFLLVLTGVGLGVHVPHVVASADTVTVVARGRALFVTSWPDGVADFQCRNGTRRCSPAETVRCLLPSSSLTRYRRRR
jgi:hypothetical protein